MKHVRILSLSLALVLMLGLFTACGKNGSTSESISDAQSSASTSAPDASVSQPDASTPDVPAPGQDDMSIPDVEVPAALTLNKKDFSLFKAGATYKLTASGAPDGTELVWTSSNDAVATVDETGTVTAVSAGSAVITVTAGELTASCTVRCKIEADKPVSGTPSEDELAPAPIAPNTPEQSKPEVPVQDHTQRYLSALNNSGCELLQYNQIYTADSADSALALEFVGLTPDMTDSFAVSFSMMNTKAFGLAAVMPAAGQTQAVADGLNSYIARMQQTFQRYLPDQYEIALAAKVSTLSDGTVILVMCEGQDAVLANIKAALG